LPRHSISTVAGHPQQYRAGRGTWLQVVSQMDPKFGGISALMPRMCESTNAAGTLVSIAAFCGADEDTRELERGSIPFSRFPLGRMRWVSDGRFRDGFNKLVRFSDGLHIHGIWDEHSVASGALARSAGKPYIVSAHGMLERWAVQHKKLKKWLYSLLLERNNLRQAACLHALTKAEVEDYRRYGLTNPIAVIPNGVDVPRIANSELFLEAYPHLRGKRLILFLSRIHHKKGLNILCQAWRNVNRKVGDAHLVLAGPDSENTRSSIESLVDQLGIRASVSFTGMLRDSMKWSALAAAELFVLPSYSEGFSVAVLEAMGMAVPVLISRPCNFPEVAEEGCGLVIDSNAPELEDALLVLLNGNRSDLVRMGNCGRELVEARYTWPAVGKQMAEVYEWMLGGPEPLRVPVF
jgi:glycosyltransferase involved in cell wall biosynthesis